MEVPLKSICKELRRQRLTLNVKHKMTLVWTLIELSQGIYAAEVWIKFYVLTSMHRAYIVFITFAPRQHLKASYT